MPATFAPLPAPRWIVQSVANSCPAADVSTPAPPACVLLDPPTNTLWFACSIPSIHAAGSGKPSAHEPVNADWLTVARPETRSIGPCDVTFCRCTTAAGPTRKLPLANPCDAASVQSSNTASEATRTSGCALGNIPAAGSRKARPTTWIV